MLSLVALFTSTCSAKDATSTPDTAQQVVQQQVTEVQQQMEVQADRLTAIERFLADQLLMKEGKAPKGWIQPPIDDYMKPGAPVSMIPAPLPPPVVSTRPARPLGPQP